jgi:hypothetical protein
MIGEENRKQGTIFLLSCPLTLLDLKVRGFLGQALLKSGIGYLKCRMNAPVTPLLLTGDEIRLKK